MARITPTINSTKLASVFGDKKVKVVSATVAGTYAAASVSADGVLLTPDQVGLEFIDAVIVTPTFTADSIEEQVVSLGPSTSSTAGWVFALQDKDDDLETGAGAVTGVTFDALIIGN